MNWRENLQSRPIWGKGKRRKKKSKHFLTAGVMVAHNINPRGKLFWHFVNNLKIRPVRPTKIYSALTWVYVDKVWKFEENPWISFWVTLFTNKQTNKQTNRRTNTNNYITSAETGGKNGYVIKSLFRTTILSYKDPITLWNNWCSSDPMWAGAVFTNWLLFRPHFFDKLGFGC